MIDGFSGSDGRLRNELVACVNGSAAAVARAIKASGAIVRLEPEEFRRILQRREDAFVVRAADRQSTVGQSLAGPGSRRTVCGRRAVRGGSACSIDRRRIRI
jgi:hypothetical protein